MLIQAAADWQLNLGQSFLIGDSDRDIQAGNVVGVQSVMFGQNHQPSADAFATVSTLAQAATVILDNPVGQ
jgi:histidinol phosphatase-like enzyme